jgi:catechol 2,3-dioxygenase-like lactoylglutathione lyase family enzyme
MKRVTGIGGIFFKCEDAEVSKKWYKDHLGIEADQYGGCFRWYDKYGKAGHTVWSTFKKETTYFDPLQSPYMVNYRVDNLVALLPILIAEGVQVVGDMDDQVYGKFAWILDPDGNKIELWEPPADFNQYTTVVQESE